MGVTMQENNFDSEIFNPKGVQKNISLRRLSNSMISNTYGNNASLLRF